ncbi:hypothetical protein [Nocardia brasiliensis]|uniref:hypothetical protein n=1 Tax=Nocardia brasiliensis TaxID=37326 RepID=UPI002457DFD9|nr:hypothetical protein [Nocardia brasiliensis]
MATETATPHTDAREQLFEMLGLLVWRLLKAVLVTAWWAVLFPMVSLPIAAAVAAGLFLGWIAGVVIAVMWLAGMVAWRLRSPRTFERAITSRARTRFLIWWRYRSRWTPLLGACKLTTITNSSTFVPRLLGVQIGAAVDLVRVRMLHGQSPADWESRTDRLAHAFGAQDCRAVITGPGVIELRFRHRDSLASPFELPLTDTGFRKDSSR